jgi:integrase
MARKVNDKVLDTREARRKLKARGKPYYRMIEPGLHLGYRRLKGQERAGTWLVRHYLGKQAYEVERIGTADDLSDADGVAILDFKQAQDKARERMVNRAHAAAGKTGPLTVAMAMNDYLGFLDSKRKSGRDARWKSEAFIVPVLGRIDVEKLTTEDLEKWLDGIAKAPARIRTKKGEKQQFRKFGEGDEVRARRATANRVWVILKAALNRAFRNKRVPSDATWRRVEKFEETDVARAEYLSVAEGVRLVNACEPALRRLVRVALATGARYGELSRLRANDFNPDSGTVRVQTSKGGKTRHIVLNNEGIALVKSLVAGKSGDALLLVKDDGSQWGKNHQSVPMRDACERAKVDVTFHGLRHTYCSHMVMNGVPLMVVAKNLGHSDTRMVEKHYGHLAQNFITDAIRKGAPTFGIEAETDVVSIDERRPKGTTS